MTNLKEVLMQEMPKHEAEEQIKEAKEKLNEMLANGEDPSDLMEEMFGLEPDYLEDILFDII